jgi:FtsP/CotA-like multicopper oxidase with cupredoxin domain
MQGHAILSGQDRLAQRGLGWTAAIIACLSSLALFGLGQPVTAQDSSVRILTPPPVAQMFRIGPNGTPAASATLSTLNSIGTPGKPDIPRCFNQTNLHSHGLWVSPAGNSDNVLVNVGARREFPI